MSEKELDGSAAKRTFGHYTLLEELGRGGQGTVWLAEDHKLKRKVALKLLRTAAGTIDEHQLERFRREAEAASKLDHPYICALFDAGDVDGVPYLAFRHIEGETLAERVAAAQESDSASASATSKEGIQATVALFEKLAHALHKAHEQGLIHRDVKPGNVMVTPDGEPIVLDFGLARDELADEQTLTHSGDLLGTPAYMSPEQLMANRVPLDRRTDVYSLGATLYECLTLQRPFAATTRAELYQKILHSDPSSVGSSNRQIPRDLQVIVETAMEKDRNRRYQTAEDLAEDLRRFREFEPIKARPIGRLLRVKRWSQRHPALATVLTATFLLLGIGLIGSWVFIRELEDQLRHTKALALVGESRDAAPTNPKLALRLALAAVETEHKRETISQLQAALAVQHERAAVPIVRAWNDLAFDVSPDGRRFVATSRERTDIRVFDTTGRQVQSLEGHVAASSRAIFSPDGRQILSLSDDKTARLWDAQSGVQLELLQGHEDEVWHGAFSPDFDYETNAGVILTTSKDKTARSWTPRGKPLRVFDGHRGPVVSPAFSPHYAQDGRLLFASLNTVQVWHHDESEPVTLEGNWGAGWRARPRAVFSPSGDRVLTYAVTDLGQVQLWDLHGKELWRFGGPGIGIMGASFSPDGERILSAHGDLTVRIWNANGDPITVIAGPAVPRLAAWSCDRSRIVVPYHDQVVRLYDVQGRELAQFAGHGSRVFWARFVEDERVVLTGSQDGTVRLWDIQAPGFRVFREHTKSIQKVRFSPEGGELMSAGEDGRVLLWDLETGRKKGSLTRHQEGVWDAEYSRRGDAILTSGSGGTVRLSGRDGKNIREYRNPAGAKAWCASFSPDARFILTTWSDGTVRLWDIDGRELERFEGHDAAPDRAAFSPLFANDGRMASAGGGNTVRLWHRVAPEVEIRGHEGSVVSVAFSDDGKRVLTASYDGTVRLWSLDGEELWKFTGHEGPVHSAEFSPNGDRIVTSSRDKTVRILDPDGNEQLTIRSQKGIFLHATFSPDGKSVAAAEGPVVRIYPVVAEDLLRLAEGKAGEFTAEELERFGDLLPAR